MREIWAGNGCVLGDVIRAEEIVERPLTAAHELSSPQSAGIADVHFYEGND